MAAFFFNTNDEINVILKYFQSERVSHSILPCYNRNQFIITTS
jgi:hypothetical protein